MFLYFIFWQKKDISGNEKKSQKFQDIFIDFFREKHLKISPD